MRSNEKTSITDNSGKFYLKNFSDGKFELIIERLGYEKKIEYVEVPLVKGIKIELELNSILLEGLVVNETRAVERETPVTFVEISSEDISNKNFGQDIPMLLNDLPNVMSYSDAGNGIGYTNLKVRGFDQKRIGVMINGIPLNDPEDHQVYWVDMPDFAESISSIQFQRGVGSSLYGISSFGGSLNMETSSISNPQNYEIYANYGSYNTYKVGTDIIYQLPRNIKLNFRLSRIQSDGYRENSASKLWSFFTNLSHVGKRSVTEINFYGGKEISHFAWDASSQSDLENNHQHNPISYYDSIDNFSQPHLEIHHSFGFLPILDMKNTLFYIHGKGFYNAFKKDRNLWEYGLEENDNGLESDLVRQKWVEKDQYGWIGQLNWKHNLGKVTCGSYISLFNSDHWGEVDSLAIDHDFQSNFKYHQYFGEKTYTTLYLNENFQPFSKVNIMTNLYFQHINYKFEQQKAGNFAGNLLNSYEVTYNFFNPRFGINYNLSQSWNIYGNLSFSKREPTDSELYDTWDGPDDLGVSPLFANADTIYNDNDEIKIIDWSDSLVKEEELTDYEFGINYLTGAYELKLNLFQMNFHNEIIAYGGVDDEGNPIRGNADETVHRGIESSFKVELPYNFFVDGSLAYNDNYFSKDFFLTQNVYNDEDWEIIDYSSENVIYNKIAGFPDFLGNIKISYKSSNLNISTQFQQVGKQYLDNTENNKRTVSSYNVVNFQCIYNFRDLLSIKNIELNLRINNIFNKIYESTGYYEGYELYNLDSNSYYHWGENHYFPASERNFMIGLRVKI